tara:strand:+ start:418 stop:873 length:456 start_codon:yes stop_codon:yes gene_type:complete
MKKTIAHALNDPDLTLDQAVALITQANIDADEAIKLIRESSIPLDNQIVLFRKLASAHHSTDSKDPTIQAIMEKDWPLEKKIELMQIFANAHAAMLNKKEPEESEEPAPTTVSPVVKVLSSELPSCCNVVGDVLLAMFLCYLAGILTAVIF